MPYNPIIFFGQNKQKNQLTKNTTNLKSCRGLVPSALETLCPSSHSFSMLDPTWQSHQLEIDSYGVVSLPPRTAFMWTNYTALCLTYHFTTKCHSTL